MQTALSPGVRPCQSLPKPEDAMTIRACVFDAYGTLFDVAAAARRAAAEPAHVIDDLTGLERLF